MDSKLYKTVYERLAVGSDLGELSSTYGINIDTLNALLHQKIVRETMHNHHKIQSNAHTLAQQWKCGEPIMTISEKLNFPPVMTAWLILSARGISRSQFRAILRNPKGITDHRLQKELTDALKKDIVYSPEAIAERTAKGKMVEDTVNLYLTSLGMKFITEQEARQKNHAKTPDFLLNGALKFQDQAVRWVECKASFGDEFEVKRDYRKQLRHYASLYGSGLVVYWYGFIDGITLDKIILTSESGLL
ncbi:MAG: TPD domain-containing protein [Candidatus Altiarchaeota archaeon]|nr:TPD domain-containing protein [Candidatus Altiarchaeota archaeon]